MKIRRLADLVDTDADVETETWRSRRLLLAGDEMGFSMHDTVLFAGTETRMHYQNHLEAVYCIEGRAEPCRRTGRRRSAALAVRDPPPPRCRRVHAPEPAQPQAGFLRPRVPLALRLFETWHVEDGMPAPRAVSCSLALTENAAHNGPLMVIGGSHRWYVSCPGRTPESHHLESLRRQEYGVPDEASLSWLADQGSIHTFTGGPGTAVFFECNAMHGSADNSTPQPRTNAFFVYNSIENQLVDPFGTDRPRPEHLANRTHMEPVNS